MIYKNKKYGNTKLYSLLEFGNGDIQVTDAKCVDHVSVLFRNHEQRAIGEEDFPVSGTTSDDYKPVVVMTFDNPDSIDVLIGMLNRAKKALSSNPH